MAIITCPECEKQISSMAEKCPKCGLSREYFNKCNIQISNIKNILISFEQDYANIFSNSYISMQNVTKKMKIYEPYYRECKNQDRLKNIIQSSNINKKQIDNFITQIETMKEKIEKHNNEYIEKELINQKEYFDNILKEIDPDILLDAEQRRAVLTEDNHCLLIAGAGAGKTTTMAAKVRYLVEKRNVRPEEIIVISYTNKAIDELKDRINKKLDIPVKIATFHAFGYEIIKQFYEKTPEVNFTSYNIILEMLEKTIYKDKQFMKNLILFMGYYFEIPEEALNFKNLEEYHMYKSSMDYSTLKSNLGDYIKTIELSRSKKKKTITGEYLRSMQEVEIANFLYLNGIEYEYEKPYGETLGNSRKQYTPDFYIKQGEKEAYIEHFGITEYKTSNIYNPKELSKYIQTITNKKILHFARGTNLIETWSSYKDKRSLREHLKEELEKKGFILKERNLEEIYKKIETTGKDKYVVKFILFMMNFIEHYKTLGYDEKGFDILLKKTDNERTLLFLKIAQKVYNYYQETLKKNNQIDYADMINEGTYYLSEIQKQGIKLPYKYIIIDEFQDIARQRFDFAKRLSEVSDAKVVAVGDDWQSIFAFAGSDITLFTKFLDIMGSGKELQITHTYRNSQELIDIAGNFIQKNQGQIKKKLISPKHIDNPVVIETFDDSSQINNNLAECIENIIEKIIKENGNKSSILLIGRYNFDFSKLEKTGKFEDLKKGNRVKSIKFPEANLSFLTAHSSKGLGYDNVIIINMFESKFGFPAQIEEDPIMKLVIHKDTYIPFAEERRLLYVALTRTKNRVYIATPINRPSRFVIELIKDYNIKHSEDLNMQIVNTFKLRCPICNFPLKYEVNKNYGLPLYICTNEPEICDFMTNSKECMKDIFKCDDCKNGYMIVKKKLDKNEYFYGCTNYNNGEGCKHIVNFWEKE